MKVWELIAMLKEVDPDKTVVVAASPATNGWVSKPLAFTGSGPDGEVVVGLHEESYGPDEIRIKWPQSLR